MTGLTEHFYRVALLRLVGSMVLALSACTAGKGFGYLEWAITRQPPLVHIGVGCCVVMSRTGAVVPPHCAFEVPGSLPLLWSVGYKKQLQMVTRDDLTWIAGVGVVLATRILANQNVTSWTELAQQARISPKLIRHIKTYVFI